MASAGLAGLTSPPTASSTLPGKFLEDIAQQMRTHSINALLIIGGFEVHPPWLPPQVP